MSLFTRQNGSVCGFAGGDSWVILSPVEQSIKRKIETAGTPLKDWDIQINYGIKTGYNDAFIISTEKRDEIPAGCQTEDERARTAALIRPSNSRKAVLSCISDTYSLILSFIDDKTTVVLSCINDKIKYICSSH